VTSAIGLDALRWVFLSVGACLLPRFLKTRREPVDVFSSRLSNQVSVRVIDRESQQVLLFELICKCLDEILSRAASNRLGKGDCILLQIILFPATYLLRCRVRS
jgi:hypothetical protein